MWHEKKQQQLDDLQRRAASNPLTREETQLLETLFTELAEEEWQCLRPALAREDAAANELKKAIRHTTTQNAALAALTLRQENLVKQAALQLDRMRAEHETLKTERARVLHDLAA